MKRLGTISFCVFLLSACGGGADPVPGSSDVTLTGVVSAPSSVSLAMRPSSVTSMLASAMLGKDSAATTSAWSTVAAGVSVKLIEVDTSGAQFGEPIATANTDTSGGYSLTIPSTFSAGPQYVVRVGSATNYIDARVVATDTLDVDPATDAASEIVVSLSDLTNLSIDELNTIIDLTRDAVVNLDDPSASSVAADIKTLVLNTEESANTIYSAVSTSSICGHVQDGNSTALANIKIVVRDYGSWVTRAVAKTNSTGDYCVNVPKQNDTDPYTGNTVTGEYIVGALNFTGTSFAASEWYTETGGANNQFGGDKVTVPSTATTAVTVNFNLLTNGARVGGIVSGHDGVFPEGMRVLFREYDTFFPLASTKVKGDGSYRINLKPGDYLISYINNTVWPYASEVHNNKHQRNLADRVRVTGLTTYTYSPILEAGAKIAGIVYTGSTGNIPDPGRIVSVEDPTLSGAVERMRTNKEGRFRFWTVPGTYDVDARGQVKTVSPTTVTPTFSTFNGDVAKLTGKLVDTASASLPVSQIYMRIAPIDTVGKVTGTINAEASSADGSFTLYAPPGNYVVFGRSDNNTQFASGVLTSSALTNQGFCNASVVNVPDTATVNLGTSIQVPEKGQGAGVGYLIGVTPNAATAYKIINSTVTCTLGTDKRVTTTATRGDGSFVITMPVGTGYVVRRSSDTTGGCNGVAIEDGKTTKIELNATTGCVTVGSPTL